MGLAPYARALSSNGDRDAAFAACTEGLRLCVDAHDHLPAADLLRALAHLWADHDGAVALTLLDFAMGCEERVGFVVSPASAADIDAITRRAHQHLVASDAVALGSAASCEDALARALALPSPYLH
jgi:hypothetical protein